VGKLLHNKHEALEFKPQYGFPPHHQKKERNVKNSGKFTYLKWTNSVIMSV
jgi:hypothetical protein